MATTINMPSLGESVTEGEVGKWLVQEGQRVNKDAPLVEIMTDKADSPVYAPEDGVVTKIHVGEGDLVPWATSSVSSTRKRKPVPRNRQRRPVLRLRQQTVPPATTRAKNLWLPGRS